MRDYPIQFLAMVFLLCAACSFDSQRPSTENMVVRIAYGSTDGIRFEVDFGNRVVVLSSSRHPWSSFSFELDEDFRELKGHAEELFFADREIDSTRFTSIVCAYREVLILVDSLAVRYSIGYKEKESVRKKVDDTFEVARRIISRLNNAEPDSTCNWRFFEKFLEPPLGKSVYKRQ